MDAIAQGNSQDPEKVWAGREASELQEWDPGPGFPISLKGASS